MLMDVHGIYRQIFNRGQHLVQISTIEHSPLNTKGGWMLWGRGLLRCSQSSNLSIGPLMYGWWFGCVQITFLQLHKIALVIPHGLAVKQRSESWVNRCLGSFSYCIFLVICWDMYKTNTLQLRIFLQGIWDSPNMWYLRFLLIISIIWLVWRLQKVFVCCLLYTIQHHMSCHRQARGAAVNASVCTCMHQAGKGKAGVAVSSTRWRKDKPFGKIWKQSWKTCGELMYISHILS